jgi:hypothetical protein
VRYLIGSTAQTRRTETSNLMSQAFITQLISIKLDALENSEFQNGKKRKTSLCLGFPVCFQ